MLHLVDAITLAADPCDICQWWKKMNKKCMTTCTGVKDLCKLKYDFFKEWPKEMMIHSDASYMLFNCDTLDKYAALLNIIFNVKFIERAIELKALVDHQLFQMHPHLFKVIGWYDMLILRYYNPMWYIPGYDELDSKMYNIEREQIIDEQEQDEILEYKDDSSILSDVSD